MTTFDIVKIYENSPLLNLTDKYKAPMLDIIKSEFNTEDQQLFVGSFFGFLNYNNIKYAIYLDNVFSWMGFERKGKCKELLVKHFKENIDYIIKDEEVFHSPNGVGKISSENIVETRGGSGKEHIYLTINCFKKLCMKARTARADIIHDYYVKLEEIVMKTVQQQACEFANLLTQKDKQIEDLQDNVENNISKHEEDLINLAKDKRVFYIGVVEENIIIETMGNIESRTDKVLKFGISKGIDRRVLKEHKKDFDSFVLKYVFITDFNVQLEDKVKEKCKDKNHVLYGRRFDKKYKNKKQTELIKLSEDFTTKHFIKEVILLKEIYDQEYITKLKEEHSLMKHRLGLKGELGAVLGTKSACDEDDIYKKAKDLEKKYDELKDKIKNNEEVLFSEDEEEIIINDHKGYSFCAKHRDWHLDSEFATTKRTKKLYTICEASRNEAKASKILNEEKNKIFVENQKRLARYQELYTEIIENADPIKCRQCHFVKEAEEFGIDEPKSSIYKLCTVCREKNYEKMYPGEEKEEILKLEDGVTFKCTSVNCGKIRPIEFDALHQRNYSNCKVCREKDSAARNKNMEEYDEFIKNPDLTLKCSTCPTIFKTEANKKKDGYYKTCSACRDRDNSAYTRNKEQKLINKKEFYQEKKEAIRAKQKEYYDANKEKIIAQKKNKKEQDKLAAQEEEEEEDEEE